MTKQSKRSSSSRVEPSKKRKLKTTSCCMNISKASIGIDDLDGLGVENIFSFLDSTALFRIILCCKRFSKILTREHVIQSSVLTNSQTERRIATLIDLAFKKRSISPPSSLRMLRLVNGRTCEVCARIEPQGPQIRVKDICYETGLFLCSKHKQMAKLIYRIFEDNQLPDVDLLRKYRTNSSKSNIILPFYGKLLTSKNEPLVPEMEYSLFQILQNKSRALNDLQRSRPSVLSNSRILPLLQCYDDALAALQMKIAEKTQSKAQKDLMKRNRVISLAAKVAYHLQQSCLENHLKDRLVDNWWCDNCNKMHYNTELFFNFFKPYEKAPSKGSNKKMKILAENIIDACNLADQTGFVGLKFLPDNNTFANAIRQYAIEFWGCTSSLILHMDPIEVHLLTHVSPEKALLRMLGLDIGDTAMTKLAIIFYTALSKTPIFGGMSRRNAMEFLCFGISKRDADLRSLTLSGFGTRIQTYLEELIPKAICALWVVQKGWKIRNWRPTTSFSWNQKLISLVAKGDFQALEASVSSE